MSLQISRRSLLLGALGAVTAPTVASLLPGAAWADTAPAAGGLSNEDFSIVVLPDTQYGMKTFPAAFTSQLDWILANRNTTWNIRYVAHVGDVVHNWNDSAQWTRARTGMSRLDDRVPYSIAPGNHDIAGDITKRDYATYNQHFPYSRYDVVPTFGASHASNRSETNWHQFSAGGTEWAILSLAWNPSAAELSWANNIVALNRDRQFIINTHQYLTSSTGKRSDVGERIWDSFASRHPNIFLVVCGHSVGSGQKRQVSTGTNGNVVHEVLSDYQDADSEVLNSYLRIMTFRPASGAIEVRTWSNLTKQYLTDATNQFTLTGITFPAGPLRVRRHVLNQSVYDAWRFKTGQSWYLPAAQMQKYPVGTTVSAAPRLIRADNSSAVYLVDQNKRRHIPNPRALKAWRWTNSDIRVVTPAEANAIPIGRPFPAYPYLTKTAGAAEVYLIDDPN